MSDLRCWQCGVEPEETADVTQLRDPEPRSIPVRWPAGDHEHEVDRPTAEQLVERGRQSFDRIMREWLD